MFNEDESFSAKACSGESCHQDVRERGQVFNNQSMFLDLTYDELEQRNLDLKIKRLSGEDHDSIREYCFSLLSKEKGIKAVSVAFSDLEGRMQVLDYDKKFLLDAYDNLTFDGSSIQGFTVLKESDLRLRVDWTSMRWLPADVFGPGKVIVFANVCDKDGELYKSDFRAQLFKYCEELKRERGYIVNVAPEIEGFLLKGMNAEQNFDERNGFELAAMSSYFNSLPQDTLRMFIDKMAEVQRSLGFQNEKDHPEVAPSQFEVNYRYTLALDAADQIQLYKLSARQIAKYMGMTASFLPKPFSNLNGNGMHCNMSIAQDGRNIFYEESGKEKLSEAAWKFTNGILDHAKELCLIMNSSVNSYRRLDPNYEAPNEIKVSSVDRGSMVRIPIGNAKSARIEVRTVAPDVNPYMCFYCLIKSGMQGVQNGDGDAGKYYKLEGGRAEVLPGNIVEALKYFRSSEYMKQLLGEENHAKYFDRKKEMAVRSPRQLGTLVKNGEVLYHHEVYNQMLWSQF